MHFNAAGMGAVQLPVGEILPAAERGVIDAVEWVAGVADLQFGFHTVWKYHMAPGVHEQVTVPVATGGAVRSLALFDDATAGRR